MRIVCSFFLLVTLLWCGCVERVNAQEQEKLRYRRELYPGLKGEIQLSGAFALYPIVVRWAEEFRKMHPDVRIDISAGGAGKGITDALAKVVDLGMVSRDVYPQELEKGAFPIAVVKDAVVPTINVNNPLIKEILATGLKRDAAVRMWAKGEVKTWGDVLGKASKIPVHVYTRSDACGAAETFAAWLDIKQEDLEGTAVFGDPGVTSVVQRDKVGIGFNNIAYAGAAETFAAWLDIKQEDLEGTAVFGDPGVTSVVQRDKVGIGFNNIAYAYDITSKKPYNNIAVMPLDLNGNGKIDPEENFYATSTELNKAIAEGKYPTPPARNLYLVARGVPEKVEVVAFLEYVLTEGQKFASEVGYVELAPEILMEELSKLQKK